MKRFVSIFAFLLCEFGVFGQGIDFNDLSLAKALIKAKQEKKYVFVDCYTTWCGPCRYMNDSVFSVAKVGDFMNPKFVCVKCDLDQPEGKKIKEKYDIRSVPTYLIFKPDGTMCHKVASTWGVDEFIHLMDRTKNEKNLLGYLANLYEQGGMSKKELLRYALTLKYANEKERGMDVRQKLCARLSNKEKMLAKYWIVFEDKKFGDSDYNFVVDNVNVFQKNVGKDIVDLFLYKNYDELIYRFMLRLQNLSLTNFSETLEVVQAMRQELSGIEIEKKLQVMERLEFLEAYLSNSTERTLEAIKHLLTSKFENQQVVYRAIEIIRNRGNKNLAKELMHNKEYLISLAPDSAKRLLASYIEELRKLV